MLTMTRRAMGVAGLAMIVTATGVWAQPAPPTVRVRGEITKVDGTTLLVKMRDGQNVTVKLAQPPRIAAMLKASLADIKNGSFIGVSAMPQPDGTQKAYAVHIFMDAQKGVVADRHGPWDSRPGSTMTNANVASTVSGNDGQNLLVKYKDGEKKIVVPPDAVILAYAVGDKNELKPGAHVAIIRAMKKPDDSLEANRVNVGRGGVVPQ